MVDKKILKKGINEITTKNAQYATNNTIKSKEKELLYPLVKDKELLKILVQEENMKKLSHRLVHTVTYDGTPKKNMNIRTNIATSTIGGQTLTQTINQINECTKEYGNELASGKVLKQKLEEKQHYFNMEDPEGGWVKNITIKTKIIQT